MIYSHSFKGAYKALRITRESNRVLLECKHESEWIHVRERCEGISLLVTNHFCRVSYTLLVKWRDMPLDIPAEDVTRVIIGNIMRRN